MDKNIYEILNKIEKCGFEAYIVGGYVRDYLLGIKSYDIDICTNALPKDIAKIFIGNVSNINYGSYKLTFNNHHIFKNIQILFCEKKWVMISKANSPSIHFVIHHPKLRNAIENFVPPIVE